jgi:HSP20 family molecular chaperone IbpA
MADVMRRSERPGWPELFDWFEGGFPTLFRTPMRAEMPGMRVEDYVEDDRYVLKAELPGIDPDKDLEITVSEGVLSIRAERHETRKEDSRSEFRYGSFARTVVLPANAKEDTISASYGDGILEITVGLGETPKEETKRITVSKT